MKTQKTKEKFIELRAECLSFDKIAKKINVSKPTLIKWNKELRDQIEEIQHIRYDEIISKFKAAKEKRIERLSNELDKAWKAYDNKDYKNLSKRELLLMILRLEKRLTEETAGMKENIETEIEQKPRPKRIQITREIIGDDGKIIEEKSS